MQKKKGLISNNAVVKWNWESGSGKWFLVINGSKASVSLFRYQACKPSTVMHPLCGFSTAELKASQKELKLKLERECIFY